MGELTKQELERVYEENVKKVKAQKDRWVEALDDESKLLTALFDPMEKIPHQNEFMTALRSEGWKAHDIQQALADKLSGYMRGLDESIEVKVSQMASFPSRYRLVCKGWEIVSFDVYRHTFGDFRKEMKAEAYREQDEQRIKEEKEEIEAYKKVLEKGLNNPYFLLKAEHYDSSLKDRLPQQLKDSWSLLRNKGDIVEGIQKEIDNQNERLVEQEEKYKRLEEVLRREQEIEALDGKVEEWRERFKAWGYEEYSRRDSRLY